jgi:hypothetical protein
MKPLSLTVTATQCLAFCKRIIAQVHDGTWAEIANTTHGIYCFNDVHCGYIVDIGVSPIS